MLKHKIHVRDEETLIYVEVTGVIDNSSYKAVAEEIAEAYNNYKYNVFCDLYNTKMNFTVEELARLPRNIEGKNTKTAHDIRIAAYVNKVALHNWRFIETINMGMRFDTKAFLDKAEALKWLLEASLH